MKTYNCFPGGKFKALTMSYDDGVIDDERLVSIFNKYGIKGTFNINAGLSSPQKLPMERLKELYAGHEIATHCYTHPTLTRCPMITVATEILKDRAELEELTGTIIRGHAYPNGSYNEEIKDLFRKLGIAYGRVTSPLPNGTSSYSLPDDPLEWHPTCHHNAPDLFQKAQYLLDTSKKQYLRLMYVWGHSYEFSNNDNWDVIEDFCKLMGGHDDIWYATNIEIIDYMEVLNRLKFSANGKCVYNPSFQSAWLEVNDKSIIEIPGGKYVDLTE